MPIDRPGPDREAPVETPPLVLQLSDYTPKLQHAATGALLSAVYFEPFKVAELAARYPASDYVGGWTKLRQAMDLNRNATAAEWEMMQKPMMRGALKGLAAAGTVIAADMAIDHFLFREQKDGTWSMVADNIVVPGIMFAPGSWVAKSAAAIGVHAIGRMLDSALTPQQARERR